MFEVSSRFQIPDGYGEKLLPRANLPSNCSCVEEYLGPYWLISARFCAFSYRSRLLGGYDPLSTPERCCLLKRSALDKLMYVVDDLASCW